MIPLSSPLANNTSLRFQFYPLFYRYYIVHSNNLLTTEVSPIILRLFNGTSNTHITETCDFPVMFSTSETLTLNFYVTPLDPTYCVVLGYNWLTKYNPLIDWSMSSITFQQPIIGKPTSVSKPVKVKLPATLTTPVPTPQVSFINAAAFARACKAEGSVTYQINITNESISLRNTTITETPINLTNVPKHF